VGPLVLDCIIIRLFEPLRDGTTEIRLLTNVPATRAGARRLAELYRQRWQIETAFQELTQYLRCEVETLGYPKAALFGFALAVAAYNVMILTKRAIGSYAGHDQVNRELSVYYLATEIATVSDGMAIAVPEKCWQRFARMSNHAFAGWLHRTASHINWRRYRKSPRGPKKPVEVARTSRGAHRSTARVLAQHTLTP
jgi:Transposase DDE domain